MTDEEFDEFLDEASAELQAKQAALEQEFGLGHNERFVVDYTTRELTFFGKEGPRALATIVPVLITQIRAA